VPLGGTVEGEACPWKKKSINERLKFYLLGMFVFLVRLVLELGDFQHFISWMGGFA